MKAAQYAILSGAGHEVAAARLHRPRARRQAIKRPPKAPTPEARGAERHYASNQGAKRQEMASYQLWFCDISLSCRPEALPGGRKGDLSPAVASGRQRRP